MTKNVKFGVRVPLGKQGGAFIGGGAYIGEFTVDSCVPETNNRSKGS